MVYGYELELTREGLGPRGSVKGILVVKQITLGVRTAGVEVLGAFRTLERGMGFVNLKVGTYEMKHSKKRKGRPVKCLRPTDKRFESILIHDAYRDSAGYLTGCIAPFIFGDEAFYRNSARAMDQLWTMLGDWERGKLVTLRVVTNVPGETRTKDTWGYDQRRK